MSEAVAEDQEEEFEQRVTALELFFDLVFVLAITQVTGMVSADPTWVKLLEALAILAALWFAWTGYAWLGNTAASDDGLVRLVMFSAMAGLLVASLAVPSAFGDAGLVFGVAYFVVRALHIGAYAVLARDDETLDLVVHRLASTSLPAAALFVAGGVLDGPLRAVVWGVALAIDYGGIVVRGVEGWRLNAAHFAERHSLVIIIALGESIVSVGVGAGHTELGAGVIAGAVLAITVAAALWWAYFDVVAVVAERRLKAAEPRAQVLMARDSFTFLHLPMVAGIVVFAVGVKKTLGHYDEHLHAVPAVALCGGVALYLLSLSAFKRRNIGSWNRQRLVVGALLLACIPAALALPALASLGLVAAIAVALMGFERLRFAPARERIRHEGSTMAP